MTVSGRTTGPARVLVAAYAAPHTAFAWNHSCWCDNLVCCFRCRSHSCSRAPPHCLYCLLAPWTARLSRCRSPACAVLPCLRRARLPAGQHSPLPRCCWHDRPHVPLVATVARSLARPGSPSVSAVAAAARHPSIAVSPDSAPQVLRSLIHSAHVIWSPKLPSSGGVLSGHDPSRPITRLCDVR